MSCPWPPLDKEESQQSNDDDTLLCLKEIRLAAKQHGYDEGLYSEAYGDLIQMASFLKAFPDTRDVVKVQVYPKTRAVSVLYIHNDGDEQETNDNDDDSDTDEHPLGRELLSKNKKSLYVAPNVPSVAVVAQIFATPLECGKDVIYTRRDLLQEKWSPPVDPRCRQFCGHCRQPPRPDKALLVCTRCKSAAYCNKQCQRKAWKQHKKECGDVGEMDVSRRWHHVAVTSGLTANKEELEEILKIAHLFDLLLFEPGGPACLCHARFGCGSVCALSSLLLEIGRQHHDVIGFASCDYSFQRCRGQVEKQGKYRASFHPCMNHDDFMEEFSDWIKELEEMIVSLKPEIRSEVLQWFFERIRCNEQIVMVDSNEMPLVKQDVTFPIHFSNMDYSRLVYGEAAEQHICFMHGTFHRVSFEDEDNDDGTEGTAEESESEEEAEEDKDESS